MFQGHCTGNFDGPTCSACKGGFMGVNCNIACQPGFTGEKCDALICDVGFTGKNCETKINECTNSPCKNGGIKFKNLI
jgi:hypothetical protein